MKRKREVVETKGSEIRSAIEELAMLVKLKPNDNHGDAKIPTVPFLSICNLVLQVLGLLSLIIFYMCHFVLYICVYILRLDISN